MKNSKPYSYSSKDRNKKRTEVKKNNNSNNKSVKKNNLLDNTIKIDPVRLNDSSSLDTSFLEARVEKKINKNRKLKDKILIDNSELLKKVVLVRKILLGFAIVLVAVLVVLFFGSNVGEFFSRYFSNDKNIDAQEITKNNNKDKVDEEEIDNNYLFVGDFYCMNFDFKDFDLDYHYVKSCDYHLTTEDIYNNLKEDVYTFNPSIVFLEAGFHDIEDGFDDDKIISYYTKIIVGIKNNRPNARIYIESLYPIDEDSEDVEFVHINNQRIKELNKKIKKLTKELDVGYLDVYNMLNSGDSLDSNYSNNGLHLNKDGYSQVLKVIKKVVG